MKRRDLIIAGGGLAGTAAALRLAPLAEQSGRTITLIDAAEGPPLERTWCYWDLGAELDGALNGPLNLRALSRKSWAQWGLRTRSGRDLYLSAPRAPYVRLDASTYFRAAIQQLAASPAVEFVQGTRVSSLDEREDRVEVRTSGSPWSAAHVIDARGLQPNRPCRLFQNFVGWDLEFDEDVLDPSAAMLMDFDVPQRSSIRFLYVLPESSRRGLFETTVFSGAPFSADQHEQDLREYLQQKFPNSAPRVLRSESGVLPMDSAAQRAQPPAGSRILHGGASGDALRPSSGYAFLACQRWASELPDLWPSNQARGWGKPAPSRSLLLRYLDRVFLAQLRADPEGAPGLFERLFERVPADRLARFLTDVPTPQDLIAIVRALPPLPLTWRALETLGELRSPTAA